MWERHTVAVPTMGDSITEVKIDNYYGRFAMISACFSRKAANKDLTFFHFTHLQQTHIFLYVSSYKGTVVEWVAAVGQAVQEEDVVALVETDKVTVDIRAKMNGVVTKQFVAV
jgi:biotin carboxyl carrier protein